MMNNVIMVNTEDFVKNYLDKTEEKVFYNTKTIKKIVESFMELIYNCNTSRFSKRINDDIIVYFNDYYEEDNKIIIRNNKIKCEYTFKCTVIEESLQFILLKCENLNHDDKFEDNYNFHHDEDETFSIDNNGDIGLISMTYMVNIKDAIVEERSLKEYKDVSPDNTGSIKTHSIPTKYFDHTQNEIRSDEDEYDENELDEIMKDIDKYLSKMPIMNPKVIPPVFIGSEKDFQKFKEVIKKNCDDRRNIKVKIVKIKK